jgi:hypothetical protein
MSPPRRPRIEVGNPFNLFPEVRPPPPSDAELRRWTYRQALQWAADRHGIMQRDRLKLLARARNYDPRWVQRLAGRHVDQVLTDARRWRERQLEE